MTPEELVREAQEIYQAEDVDRMLALFTPDAVVFWNGRKVAEGTDEIRRFHEDRLGFGRGRRRDFRLEKRLRAASGDTISVEWTSRSLDEQGRAVESFAGEFWTMRGGLLAEWHAYNHRYVEGEGG